MLSYENREPGKLDMSAHLKVNDFTHKKLINDIKDFFGSVSDWHSRERRRSKALSAQRYFCGFFFYSFLSGGQILYSKIQTGLDVARLWS